MYVIWTSRVLKKAKKTNFRGAQHARKFLSNFNPVLLFVLSLSKDSKEFFSTLLV